MFEKIKKTLGIANAETRTDAALVQAFLRGDDLPFQGDGVFDHGIKNPYQQNIAVFRCINIISSSLSRVPMRLMRRDKEIKNGKVYNLLSAPNAIQNRIEFLNMLLTQLHISGNVYIYIDGRNSSGVPRALILVPPERVSPIRGAGLYDLEAWEIKGKGVDTIRVKKEDIIHIRYAADPVDPLTGLGPVDISQLAVDTDYAAAVYNRSVMKNGGLPSGILSYKGPGKLTEDMKEEIRQSWYRTYGSPRASSRLAVTNSDWTFQPTGTSQKEMEFLEARRWNLVDIARAFNVPVMYLNDDSTGGLSEASITIQRRMFYEENLIPLARKIEEIITSELLVKLDNMLRLEFDFSNIAALQVDYNSRVSAGHDLQKMGFSINQINNRLDLGMTDEPWGDEHLSPVNMVPTQDILDHSVVLPSTGEEAAPEEESSEGVAEAASGMGSVRWAATAAVAQKIEKKCTNKMRRLFLKQRSSVLRAAGEMGDNGVSKLLDSVDSIDSGEFAEGIVPFVISSYSEGAIISSLEKNGETEDAASDAGKFIGEATNYCANRYSSLVNLAEESKEIVRQELTIGSGMGEDQAELCVRIRKIFNIIISRARVLSRTEVFSAHNAARYMVLSASPEEGQRAAWLSGNCKNHTTPARSVPIGSAFDHGVAYPGQNAEDDPQNIGCTCLIALDQD